MTKKIELLVVAGFERSGTSMLTRTLNAHPDIKMTFEFGNCHRFDLSVHEHLNNLRTQWWKRRIIQNHRKNNDRWTQWKNRFASRSFVKKYSRGISVASEGIVSAEVVRTVLGEIFPNVSVVGDKPPFYAREIDRLAADKTAKTLVIFRDVRDVAVSYAEMVAAGKWRQVETAANHVEMALEWVASIESMFRNADDLCMLRYEDVVHNPSRELVKLGEWLNVDPERFPTGGFKGTSVGRFKTTLAPMEVGEIEDVAKLGMQRAGYI